MKHDTERPNIRLEPIIFTLSYDLRRHVAGGTTENLEFDFFGRTDAEAKVDDLDALTISYQYVFKL